MAARAQAVAAPAGAARRAAAQVAAADRDAAAGRRAAAVQAGAVAAAEVRAETEMAAARVGQAVAAQEARAVDQAVPAPIRLRAMVDLRLERRIEIAGAAAPMTMNRRDAVAIDQATMARQRSGIIAAGFVPTVKGSQTEAMTRVTSIDRGIIVAEGLIVIATETATNGVVENMNGVAPIMFRGLISIRITATISTAQTPMTTATKTGCLLERMMRDARKAMSPNARTFTSTRAAGSCQSLGIQTLTAPLITMVFCGDTKKDSGIGSLIS